MPLPPADWFTFASDDMWLSEFRLAPGSREWDTTRATTDAVALIAFPRTSVAIRHERKREVIADPLAAVLYSPGQAYSRRLISAAGDECTILAVSCALIAEIAGEFDGRAGRADYRFPFVAAPLGRADFASIERVRSALASDADPRAIQEELLWLAHGVVASGYKEIANRPKAATAAQVELANAVREEIGRDLAEAKTLGHLARQLATSQFHLARVFRSVTGRPIHAYSMELRLRSSLPLLAGGLRIADVAQQVGFASHAHLTDRFVRAFGVPPTRWREMSKNVEAREGRALIA